MFKKIFIVLFPLLLILTAVGYFRTFTFSQFIIDETNLITKINNIKIFGYSLTPTGTFNLLSNTKDTLERVGIYLQQFNYNISILNLKDGFMNLFLAMAGMFLLPFQCSIYLVIYVLAVIALVIGQYSIFMKGIISIDCIISLLVV